MPHDLPLDAPMPCSAGARAAAPAALRILDGVRADASAALVINLFGGPGVGKSTMAARLFSALKARGVETASPEEHAKLAIWGGQAWLLRHQPVMLGRALETILTLQDKVDVIVVDSPTLLCSIYASPEEPACFHELCADIHRRSHRVNILLRRPAGEDYEQRGRMQTLAEAVEFDARIGARLDALGDPYAIVEREHAAAERIANAVASWVRARKG